VYSVKGLLNFGESFCLQYDVGHWSTSTKQHGVSSQDAAGYTEVETASICKYRDLCMGITFTNYPSF